MLLMTSYSLQLQVVFEQLSALSSTSEMLLMSLRMQMMQSLYSLDWLVLLRHSRVIDSVHLLCLVALLSWHRRTQLLAGEAGSNCILQASISHIGSSHHKISNVVLSLCQFSELYIGMSSVQAMYAAL